MPRDFFQRALRRLLSPLIREIVREEMVMRGEVKSSENVHRILRERIAKTIRQEIQGPLFRGGHSEQPPC